MTSKFVVRLLSDDDALLSWAEVWASPSPQPGRASCPFYAQFALTKFLIEAPGVVTQLSVHWPDLDVARVTALTPTPVQPCQVFDFIWIEPVWLVAGMSNVVLPGVTIRQPVALAPSSGALSASIHPAQIG